MGSEDRQPCQIGKRLCGQAIQLRVTGWHRATDSNAIIVVSFLGVASKGSVRGVTKSTTAKRLQPSQLGCKLAVENCFGSKVQRTVHRTSGELEENIA